MDKFKTEPVDKEPSPVGAGIRPDEGEVPPKATDPLERIAVALERMLEEPAVEIMEPTPPICPYCNSINPVVTTEDSGGSGQISEFIIRGNCGNCGNIIFAVSNEWVLHPDSDSVQMHLNLLSERNERSGGNGTVN